MSRLAREFGLNELLPAARHAAGILERIDSNRVTLIIGATGCGKSAQVPKMLRTHLGKSVLCVQPRRMAVVAVATRLAEELGERLGEGVVGFTLARQSKLSSGRPS